VQQTLFIEDLAMSCQLTPEEVKRVPMDMTLGRFVRLHGCGVSVDTYGSMYYRRAGGGYFVLLYDFDSDSPAKSKLKAIVVGAGEFRGQFVNGQERYAWPPAKEGNEFRGLVEGDAP
jgi:hypothetical protein